MHIIKFKIVFKINAAQWNNRVRYKCNRMYIIIWNLKLLQLNINIDSMYFTIN